MRLRDRIRQWLMEFLGILGLEKTNQARHGAMMEFIRSEFSSAQARDEDRHGELIERLAKLEQHFVSQHVGRPTVNLPVYDWEQVQIQELAEMLANPPKEVA